MPPTGSDAEAVWPAATPLKPGRVTKLRIALLPGVSALRTLQERNGAGEGVENEAGDQHANYHDRDGFKLFLVHRSAPCAWDKAQRSRQGCASVVVARQSKIESLRTYAI